MKTIGLVAVLAVMIFLIGCSKDDAVSTKVSTDTQAITQMVTSVDSVAEFSQADETTINDGGELDWAKSGYDATLTAVKVFKWGRKITNIDRNVNVTTLGDTAAIAYITKIVTGNIVIAASYSDTAQFPDTLIRKPFTEQLQRKVLFARVGHFNDPERNWRPVAITLGSGNTVPDSSNKFAIESLEFYSPNDTVTITDPLSTWLKYGGKPGSVPNVWDMDSLIVRVKLFSTDDSTESVALRGICNIGDFRSRMALVSSTTVSGGYERTYEKRLRATLQIGHLMGHVNIVADVNSWGTLNDDNLNVSNKLWGFPYDIRPRRR